MTTPPEGSNVHRRSVRGILRVSWLMLRHPRKSSRLGDLARVVNHVSLSVLLEASQQTSRGEAVAEPMRVAHAAATWAVDLEALPVQDDSGIRERYATQIVVLAEALRAIEAAADGVVVAPNDDEKAEELRLRLGRFLLAFGPLATDFDAVRDDLRARLGVQPPS